jgi:4-amino-4-deoxy-L-arabinose transferase-like glycosyltransferase
VKDTIPSNTCETGETGAGKRAVGLLAVCLLALLLRLIPFLLMNAVDPGRAVRPDTGTYEQPALALLKLGRFAQHPQTPDRPEIGRTPGYPLFIAISYAAFGEDHRPLILLQILIGVGTVALAWLLAKRLWGESAAAHAAAVLLAFDPLSILYSQLLISESLFACLLTLHCLVVLQLLNDEKTEWLWGLAAGATLAAATHVRPIAYFMILPLLTGLIWAKRRQGRAWRPVLAMTVVVLLAWMPPVVGWQWRNWRAAGIREFSAIQDHNLLFYRAAGVVALRDGINLTAAQQTLLNQAPAAAHASDAQWYAYCRRRGLALLKQYPVLTLRTQLAGLFRIVVGPGHQTLKGYFGKYLPGATLYSLVFLIGIYVLVAAAAGRLAGWGRRPRAPFILAQHVFLWGVVTYLLIVSAGPEAYSRFRLPMMPILAAYAGGGWSCLRRRPSSN